MSTKGPAKRDAVPETTPEVTSRSKWTVDVLENVLSEPLTNGRSVPDAPSGFPVLRLTAVRDGRIDISERKIGALTSLEATRFAVRSGDFLIVRGNGSKSLVGQGGLVGPLDESVAYPDTLIRARPDARRLDVRFLATLWGSPVVRGQIERAARTTAGIYKVNQQDLNRIEIPIPPLGEQLRIVDEVEKQFTRLDAAVAGLQRVKANLKRYRASVLKAACEGRLVPTEAELARREGRSFESGEELLKRILPRTRATLAGSPKALSVADDRTGLPEGWGLAMSGEIFSFVTSGSRGWAKYYSEEGSLFLRIGNLDHDSVSLDLSEVQRVTPPKGAEGERTRVLGGDILVSITADLGMVALVPSGLPPAFINQHIALARPINPAISAYVAWHLASAHGGGRQFRALQRGATKQGLGLDDVRGVAIPIPPLAEQQRIVAEVERRLSVVNELEATIDKNLARCARLRQSILKMAFEGRLVPQDPNDEPASVLLERIRRERDSAEVAGAPPRRRKVAKR